MVSPPPSPALWHRYDSAEGVYFYNPETGESRWTDPSEEEGGGEVVDYQGEESASYDEYGGYAQEEYPETTEEYQEHQEHQEHQEYGHEEYPTTPAPAQHAGADGESPYREEDYLPNSPAVQASEEGQLVRRIDAGGAGAGAGAGADDVESETDTGQPALLLGNATGAAGPLETALERTGWVRYYTPAKDAYYYNLEKGETQWTIPNEVQLLAQTISRSRSKPGSPLRSGKRSSPKKKNTSDLASSHYEYAPTVVLTSPPTVPSASPTPFTDKPYDPASSSASNALTVPGQKALTTADLAASATPGAQAALASQASPVFLSKIRRRFKALSLAHSAPSFSALFASFDLSGQNSLSPAEFKLAVRSGLNISSRELTDRDIEILLKTLDTDKDGRISLDEFSAFLSTPAGRLSPTPPPQMFKSAAKTINAANLMRRSLVGIPPPPPKSNFSSAALSREHLSLAGGARPSYARAKDAKVEMGNQERFRAHAKARLQSTARAVHAANMATKIMAQKPAKERLAPRTQPRGSRKADKTWQEASHRMKIAHAATKIWKSPEIRHAAYDAMLGEVQNSGMKEIFDSYDRARHAHRGSKVTPAVLETIRKRLKAAAYTPYGTDYLRLFTQYDADRTGLLVEDRWRIIIRKECKLAPPQLSNEDVTVVFETVAGESIVQAEPEIEGDEGKEMVVPNEGIDLQHFLRFVKTDVPAALSLSKENSGRVSQAEVMMYVIEKAKARLNEVAVRSNVHDWGAVFKLYDVDGNGTLSFSEFSKIFRTDLRLSDKELNDQELKLVFDFIDDDSSDDISAKEFVRFLNSGKGDKRFPVRGDHTELNVDDFYDIDHMEAPKLTESGMESHVWYAEQEHKKKVKHMDDITELVKKRLRAHSYTTHGQDWSIAFEAFDKSHDGYVSFDEFRVAMRKIVKIPPLTVPDKDLHLIFRQILKDEEQQDWCSLKHFADFMGKERDGAGADVSMESYKDDWVYEDEDAAKDRLIKTFKHKVLQASYKSPAGIDLNMLFHAIDKDSSGTITMEELMDAVRRLMKISETTISKAELKTIFQYIDYDKSGQIDISEFTKFLHQ